MGTLCLDLCPRLCPGTLPSRRSSCSIRRMNKELLRLNEDPEAAAAAAGLCYVHDDQPGIRRKRWGRGFTYLDPQGNHIKDPEERQRFAELAIPPAWSDVWISPDEKGHIQATGRDDKDRKQYIYHPCWQELRNETKFNRMLLLGEALPRLRAQIDEDLRKRGTPRERVVAAVVRLLQETLIRVGNAEYARENNSYGLTTMRTKHLDLEGTKLHFEFRGKSGKMQRVDVRDPRVARVVKQCQELPGYELFQYVDEAGERHRIESGDVNDYVRAATGENFTAKDFRTWGGTVHAVRALQQLGPCEAEDQADKNIVKLFEMVAAELGNTPAVCRRYYVHPAIPAACREGSFFDYCAEVEGQAEDEWLEPEEQIALLILRRALEDA